jgi:hypothetical protein
MTKIGSGNSKILVQPIDSSEVLQSAASPAIDSPAPVMGKWSSWHWSHLLSIALLSFVCFVGLTVSAQWNDALRQITPETLPFPSTHNKHQSGYSALMELCNKLGMKTVRFEQPYRMLKEKNLRGTLVVVGPMESFGPEDCERIADWVAAGNNILYFDYFVFGPGRRLLSKLGASAHDSGGKTTVDTVKQPAKIETPLWKFVNQVIVRSDTKVSGGLPLAEGTPGTVLMLKGHERGECLLGSDVGFCANERISDPAYKGNFQMVLNFLMRSKQPVYFDEKCHGFSSSINALIYLCRRYAGSVAAQLLLIAVIAWVSLNQRFGRPLSISTARKISNLEFIDGLAATFRRANARGAAWAMMYHPLRVRLCRNLGQPPDVGAATLAAVWSEAAGNFDKKYDAFLTDADKAALQSNLSEKELLSLIERSDELTKGSKELALSRRFLGA